MRIECMTSQLWPTMRLEYLSISQHVDRIHTGSRVTSDRQNNFSIFYPHIPLTVAPLVVRRLRR